MDKKLLYSQLFYIFLITFYIHGSSTKKKWRTETNRILVGQIRNTLALTENENSAEETSVVPTHEGASEAHEAEHEGHEEVEPFGTPMWWTYLGIILGLTIMAGICSGQTVGMMSIDMLNLKIAMQSTDQIVASQANSLHAILENHHLLQGTLLVSNATCMECLPIFLDKQVPAVIAIIISTTLVQIFGEVIPMAYCTGPSQLMIATKMIPVVKVLMCITYPISKPIQLSLDAILGVHGDPNYARKDLRTLIQIHEQKKGDKQSDDHETKAGLSVEEIKIITSTIDLREQKVTEIMIPKEQIFMISDQEIINQELITKIEKKGYTRVPIYSGTSRDSILWVLSVKRILSVLNTHRNKKLGSLNLDKSEPFFVSKDTHLLHMLSMFQEKKSSICIVVDKEKKAAPAQKFADLTSKRDFYHDQSVSPQIIQGLIHIKDIFEQIVKAELDDGEKHAPVTGFGGGGQFEMKPIGKFGAKDIAEAGDGERERTQTGKLLN